MPALARSEWYDLARDMNWKLSYVDDETGVAERPFEQFWHTDGEVVGLGRAL